MAFNPFRKKTAVISEIVSTPSFFSMEFLQHFLAAGVSASDQKFLELYLKVPELQAIINYRGRVFAGMHVKPEDKDGNEKEIPQLGLFSKPNPLQNFKELAMQYHVLRDIFGNAFIHPVFGNKKDLTTAIWNLPPANAEVIPTEAIEEGNQIVFNMTKLDEIIKEYVFRYLNTTINYTPEEIIHFNDNQIQFKDNKYLLGDSKIRPLQQPCENILHAYEARGVLIQNSALGILTNDSRDAITGTLPLSKPDKEQLQEDYKKYGLTKAKWQMIITNAALKWQSMAVDTGKLKLFEEVDADYRTIANAYSFPPEILQTDSTYENKQRAIVQLYQDAIIPEANEFLQGIGNFLQLDNVFLKADFSHIAALQADLEKRSRTLNWAATGLSKAKDSGFIDEVDATEEFKKYLL